jgi:hypothetical protein
MSPWTQGKEIFGLENFYFLSVSFHSLYLMCDVGIWDSHILIWLDMQGPDNFSAMASYNTLAPSERKTPHTIH